MIRNMYKIAGRTDWKVLEDFYKDLGDDGLKKNRENETISRR